MKEVLAETGMLRLKGDEAYYHCHNKDGVLEGMISSHVDDFILAGNEEFLEEITNKIRKKLDISKLEDKDFRFTGIDVNKVGDSLEFSMDEYAKSFDK